MSERVMLACGDAAFALHTGSHDGLPEKHPSCFVHDPPASCTPVPVPSLEGRRAFCGYYGGKPYKSGPIYPDDDTRNGGLCTSEGCFCVVPSSMALPFFTHEAPAYERRCANRTPTGVPSPWTDAQGYCRYRESAHKPREHSPQGHEITVRYKGRCERCGLDIRVGARAFWFEKGRISHLEADCRPEHAFVPRTDLGQDTFYCGCGGWD